MVAKRYTMQRPTVSYTSSFHIPFAEDTSLSNHVGTALRTYPYFMALVGVNVESVTNIALLFLWTWIVRITQGKAPFKDQMCGNAGMFVRWVVSVACNWSVVVPSMHRARDEAYGPSVQVKTWLKPHPLTSASASFLDFDAMIVMNRS